MSAAPSETLGTTRKSLFVGELLQIGWFEARPATDACGDVERQDRNAIVLPLSGVFAKHETSGRHVIGTPSHAVLFAPDAPYRIGFPGGIGDRALTLRFDRDLAPDLLEARGARETTAPIGLLPGRAMVLRNLLRTRLKNGVADALEIETLGLDLLGMSLDAMRNSVPRARPATLDRRMRAVERVKEAVAMAPGNKWSVTRLAGVAHLSPFHLCRVFHEIAGTSLYDYVLRERLAQSLDAVLDGDDITGIALDAGFTSHSHFTARFGAFFGCTPATLRRHAKTGHIAQLRKMVTARPV